MDAMVFAKVQRIYSSRQPFFVSGDIRRCRPNHTVSSGNDFAPKVDLAQRPFLDVKELPQFYPRRSPWLGVLTAYSTNFAAMAIRFDQVLSTT